MRNKNYLLNENGTILMRKERSNINLFALLLFVLILFSYNVYSQETSLKNISRIKGTRANQLVGYGIVVGLKGTGDKQAITSISTQNLLKKYGIRADGTNFTNVASVIVTSSIPAFAKEGDKLDVTVSAIADSKNLSGGVLLQTELKGYDGKTYAVAQGNVTIGGFNAGKGNKGAQKNHETVGKVINGGIIEREVPTNFIKNGKIKLVLNREDFTLVYRVAKTINKKFGYNRANPLDASTIDIDIPYSFTGNEIGFISQLENMTVKMNNYAKIVVNEKTGTIVMGSEVKISAVAISHAGISIQVGGGNQNNRRGGKKDEGKQHNVISLPENTSIGDLIETLNLIGVGTRDMIAIFQAIKASGALHAEIVFI